MSHAPVPDPADDWETPQRRKQAEDVAEIEAGLAAIRSRKGVYREQALSAPVGRITDAQCSWLCRLLEYADDDLDNSFPSRKTLAAKRGVHVKTVDYNLKQLEEGGWIRRVEFRRQNGQQSSSGYQFLIPPGVISPNDPMGWEGPASFSKRAALERKASRRKI